MPTARLIGRDALLEALAARLPPSGVFVLTGCGGIGKTAVATALLARLEAGGADALHCWLSSPVGCDGLIEALAVALHVEAGHRSRYELLHTIGRALAARGERAVVLLDAFEAALADGGPEQLAGLVRMAPAARFVITSRVWIDVAGAVHAEIGPLSLDPADGQDGLSPAAELFLVRARQARPIARSPALDAQIEALVARLDGLPLAIEIVAARAAVLTVSQVAARFRRDLDLLDASAGPARGSSGTLRHVLEASWAQLPEAGRWALRQLAVFEGPFDLRAAEGIAHGGPGDLLDAIQSLVRSSLLRVDGRDEDGLGYAMYDVVRAFGRARLADAGEEDAVRARHRAYFLDADRLDDLGALTCWQPERLARIHRSAHHYWDLYARAMAAESPRPVEAARALARLWPALASRSLERLAVERLGALVEAFERGDAIASDDALGPMIMAHVMRAEALMRAMAVDEAEATLAPALATCEAESGSLRALVYKTQAKIDYLRGRVESSRRALDRAAEALGDAIEPADLIVAIDGMRCHQDVRRGRLAEAARFGERALAAARREGNPARESFAALMLHDALRGLRREADRRALLEQATEAARRSGRDLSLAGALLLRAIAQHEAGRLHEAEALCEQALALLGDEAAPIARGEVLAVVGWVRHAQQRFDHAIATFRRGAEALGEEPRADLLRGCARIAERVAHGEPADEAPIEPLLGRLRDRGLAREAALLEAWHAFTLGPDARRAEGLRAALRPPTDAREIARQEAIARLARADLERLTEAPAALLVTPDMRWIRPPGSDWLRIGRRRVQRALLGALVRARTQRPGHPVTLDEFWSTAWPDEGRSDPDSIRNRLNVALHEIRALGVGDGLLHDGDGWLLSTELPVWLVFSR